MNILVVTWEDSEAVTDNAWASEDDLKDLEESTRVVVSCGMLVVNHDDYLILAVSYTGSEYGGLIKIPRKAIVETRKVGECTLNQGSVLVSTISDRSAPSADEKSKPGSC